LKLNRAAFRTRTKYLLGVASEIGRPVFGLAGRLAAGPPTSPALWRSGLIVSHNHIGDLLYRTCSLAALTQMLPNCRWDYLTAPATGAVLMNNPAIRNVHSYQTGDESWNLSEGTFATLAAAKYDAILCTNVVRYYPDFLLAVALRIPNRVGFTLKGLSGLLTFPVDTIFPTVYPGYFANMVASVGGGVPNWKLVPRVFPDKEDLRSAAAAWELLELASDRPVVAFSVTTRQPGAWPSEHYVRAVEQVHEATGAQLVLFGSPNEEEMLRSVIATMRAPCKLLGGRLNLRALAVFLGRCSAVLAMDSGPRHLANTSGVPVVFGRNLIFSRIEAGAYSDNEIDAAPADELVPPDKVQQIIARIDPARTARLVIDALGSKRTRTVPW
jgi:ADP-heptose:LPS heptosyltransferase